MSASESRRPRRSEALSPDRIVAAAVEILDAEGERSLTVRALSAHLETGRGALYHHVAGMDELLAAATDHVVGQVTRVPADGAAAGDAGDPAAGIRALALGLWDAIDAHPWVGTQLSRAPLQPAVLRLWSAVGVRLRHLGVAAAARADAGATLVAFVLGASAQHAAGARRAPDEAARRTFLADLAEAWAEQDDDGVAEEASALLQEHDDRAQFLAGVDIVLAGIARTGC